MVLNEDRMNRFLANVSQGFGAPSTEELLALVIAVVFLTLLIVFVPLWQRRRRIRRQTVRSRQLFEEAVLRLQLSPGDASLMRDLAEATLPPTELHTILNDRVAFERSARRAEELGLDSLQLLFLRVRANMHLRIPGQSVRSTADLAPGDRLELTPDRIELRVRSVLDSGLLCEFDSPPATGKDYSVLLHRSDGRYRFRTAVLQIEGELALLQHDAAVRREQKRAYIRVRSHLPVMFAGRYGETENIGGGGAALRIHDARYQAGEVQPLEILLPREDGADERVRCQGQVVAVNPANGLLHLQFLELREGVRDRIIRYVFRESERSRFQVEQGSS